MILHRALAMSWALFTLTAQAMLQSPAQPRFNLYPAVDPQRLAKALGVSSGCLSALNTTVTCDPTLLGMAGTVDNYLWNVDNATTLCTSDCLSSAQAWYDAVNNGCFDDSDRLTVRGKLIPLYTVPGRTLDGLNLACLTPATNVSADAGVGGTILVVDSGNSNETDSGSNSSGDENGDGSATGYNNSSPAWKRKRQTSSTASTGFCLIDSYAWVGSDIIRPDCSVTANQNHSQCVDPTDVPAENQRLANLYPDSILCDVCFVNLFYLRLASPYLADLDHSDYLIQQYYDILGVCNITHMPDLLVREPPDYDDAPGILDGLPINGSSSSTEQPFASDGGRNANGTCPSRTLTYAELNEVADRLNSRLASNSTADDDFCDALATTFHVATGDLFEAFGNFGCDISSPNATNATWCISQSCAVYNATGSSCDAVAAANNITTQQLVRYNPHLQGTCDQLYSQYLCVTPPGGAYIPPPTNVSASSGGDRQRGGYGGGGAGTTLKGNPEVVVPEGGSPPVPTQPGIVAGCVRYSNTSAGDGCVDFATVHKITPVDLFKWNTVLGAGGANCSTEFWVGYYYCIGVGVASTPSASTTPSSKTTSPSKSASPPSSTASPVVLPSPTQDGIPATCDKYAQAKAGDGCNAFAAAHNITPADLFEWNTVLGAGGADCATELWAGYYYCVHAT